jgi:hypothetical protein
MYHSSRPGEFTVVFDLDKAGKLLVGVGACASVELAKRRIGRVQHRVLLMSECDFSTYQPVISLRQRLYYLLAIRKVAVTCCKGHIWASPRCISSCGDDMSCILFERA